MALDVLPQDEQIQVIQYVLHHRGAGVSVTEVFEGALAMRSARPAARDEQATDDDAAIGGTAAAGATGAPPAPVEPGPWAPPGEQPIPFYIGNEAHKGIADRYRAAHAGDSVFSNYAAISRSSMPPSSSDTRPMPVHCPTANSGSCRTSRT